VALAGKVGASSGGNISAQQITRAGVPARLSTAEQGTLTTIDTLPDTALQGAAREYVANSYFTRNGFTPLEGKCGSGNCFDGVYVKGNMVYLNEVKPLNANGSIRLSGPSGKMDTQMTDAWISSAIGRLKEGTPVQRQTAAAIEKVLNTPNLVKIVTGVNSNGMTIVKLQ
jgi:filamentous hemagglutinin